MQHPSPSTTHDDARRAQARAELAQIVTQMREAHFATDAAQLLAHDADLVVWVREGAIHEVSHAESLADFTEDMRDASYQEWDYQEEPIIRIAADASLAWVISRVKVRRMKQRGGAEPVEERFLYAGIDTYERRDGRWTRIANVSTFAEG